MTNTSNCYKLYRKCFITSKLQPVVKIQNDQVAKSEELD